MNKMRSSIYRPARSLHLLRFKSPIITAPRSSPVASLRRPPSRSPTASSSVATSNGIRVWGLDCQRWRLMSAKANLSSSSSELAMKQVVVEDGDVEEHADLWNVELDDYDGVIINVAKRMESGEFLTALRASVARWKVQGKKGVWIKLPIEHANLVEAAIQEGFWYHHAEPKYLMLVNWISKCPNTLPAYASHRVGVAAFVMTEKNEVLVVQENSGKFKGTGIWKFPTGVVDEGEDICDAARREVKEETGIEAEFIEVLAFRQSHEAFFGKSDIFFVCLLRPISFGIQIQESEILDAKWMPYEEYAAQPLVTKNDLLRNIMNICAAKANHSYSGFTPVSTASAFSDKKHFLYLNGRDLNKLKL